MRNLPDRESIFQETMARLGAVSPSEGADVFLHYFMSVLGGLDAGAARQLQQELSTRFGGRYCSGHVCGMMSELVNGHLASRAPHARN